MKKEIARTDYVSEFENQVTAVIEKATKTADTTITDKKALLDGFTKDFRILTALANKTSTAFSLRAGEILKNVRDTEAYKGGDFKSVTDYAKTVLEISPATVTNSIKVVEFVEANNGKYDLKNIPYKALVELSYDHYSDENKQALIDNIHKGMSTNKAIELLKSTKVLTDKQAKRLKEKEQEKRAEEESRKAAEEAVDMAVEYSYSDAGISQAKKQFSEGKLDLITGYPTSEEYARLVARIAKGASVIITFSQDHEYKEEIVLGQVISYCKVHTAAKYDEYGKYADALFLTAKFNDASQRDAVAKEIGYIVRNEDTTGVISTLTDEQREAVRSLYDKWSLTQEQRDTIENEWKK